MKMKGGCRCRWDGAVDSRTQKLQTLHAGNLHAGGGHTHVDTSKRNGSKHGSFEFDSVDDIGQDASEVLSHSAEPESKKDGLPEQDPAEVAVEVYARIR